MTHETMTDAPRYVLLNAGDVIQEGDEWYGHGGWRPTLIPVGMKLGGGGGPVRRADLSPLAAVAMRDALMDIADPTRLTSYGDPGILRERASLALDAIPTPDAPALLAAALRLPEVARLVAAVGGDYDFCMHGPRREPAPNCEICAALAALGGTA
ncbi:MAG: hypothetical protein JWQ44_2950 [Chthoniobacter sp.]|nr:hypothetical protein [Chthoniobacter sp.]